MYSMYLNATQATFQLLPRGPANNFRPSYSCQIEGILTLAYINCVQDEEIDSCDQATEAGPGSPESQTSLDGLSYPLSDTRQCPTAIRSVSYGVSAFGRTADGSLQSPTGEKVEREVDLEDRGHRSGMY